MTCLPVQIMELVELEGLANSIVGKPGMSGLSVEQRKRLTIAVELVANPSVIFMVGGAALPVSTSLCMHALLPDTDWTGSSWAPCWHAC